MSSLNKVMLMGNCTRDPELKQTPKGTPFCEVGMAINRNYTTESGEKREEVLFVDITLWGRTAEVAGDYLKKGRPFFIEGRLQLDTWDDKTTGTKRSKLKVIGDNLQLLGGKPQGEEGGERGGGGQHRSGASSGGGGYQRREPANSGGGNSQGEY